MGDSTQVTITFLDVPTELAGEVLDFVNDRGLVSSWWHLEHENAIELGATYECEKALGFFHDDVAHIPQGVSWVGFQEGAGDAAGQYACRLDGGPIAFLSGNREDQILVDVSAIDLAARNADSHASLIVALRKATGWEQREHVARLRRQIEGRELSERLVRVAA